MRSKIMKEQIYECEAKKLFLRNGQKRWEWVVMPVKQAIEDGVISFRCKDCHGVVRLHNQRIAQGPEPHIEHKSRQDSEYCPLGMHFRQNPGREPRLSSNPVN